MAETVPDEGNQEERNEAQAEEDSMEDGFVKVEEEDPLLAEGWTDILDSRELYRKVIRKADEEGGRPVKDEMVTVRVRGKTDQGTEVDCYEGKLWTGNCDVIHALDMVVQLMEVGEIDLIRTTARFAYGSIGRDPDILPDASLTYEIQLIKIEDPPAFSEMSSESFLAFCDTRKEKGNYYYQRKEFTEAIQVYQKVIEIVSETTINDSENRYTREENKAILELTALISNNMAAAQLKMGLWDEALEAIETCLTCNPHNVKAIFRKAKVLRAKDNLEEALDCLRLAKTIEPNSKLICQEIESVKSILSRRRAQDKTLYRKMLKGLQSDEVQIPTHTQMQRLRNKLTWPVVIPVLVVILGIVLYFYGFYGVSLF